ncbi:hypothetical protein [Limnoglobus roseus]|uniref:Uncharacterized protein n=1 Tax=Limnoglobus roseus TaxID=2598579 RepID=A0A5C1AIP4_9BACT|nr:hypothetical protein [Limnoglobus roseus]QEL17562.1 hypothetical protein PX52LOC_04557 [Limnoglobus roseus]
MSVSSPAQWQFGSIVLSYLQSEMRTEKITDPGGVSVTASKHTITARGVVTRGLAPTTSPETPSQTFDRIKNALMRHRRYFVYAPFGQTMVEVGDRNNPNDPDANRDHANGPKVIDVRPVEIAEAAFLIEVVVEVTLASCDTATRKVLNHHFKYDESRDIQGYRTRTVEGMIVCRDRTLTKQQALKEAGIPAVAGGYQEIDFESGWEPDGLTLKYHRTEEQYEMRPPDEAADAVVTTQISTRAGTAAAYATITVELTGNVDRKYSEAVALATKLMFSVAMRYQVSIGKTSPILNISYRGGTKRKSVSATMTVLVDAKKVLANGSPALRSDLFSEPPVGMFPQGSAAYTIPADTPNEKDLLRAPFQEPCSELVKLPTPSLPGTLVSGPNPFANLTGGGLQPTPGPIAGGGGVGGGILIGTPGGGNGGNTTVPPNLTPQEIANILGGLIPIGPVGPSPSSIEATAFGVAIPTGGGAAADGFTALLDGYNPQAGGVGGADNSFGSFGSNPVTSTPTPTTKPDPADDPSTYSVYYLTSEIDEETGKRVMPNAAAKDPSTGQPYPNPVTQTNRGKATVTIRWTAVRYGVPPQEPDPLPPPCKGDFILLNRWVRRDNPQKADSGHLKFTATGKYVYGHRRPERLATMQVIAPFLLPQVKAQFPGGLPEATVAKDPIWWGIAKVPSPLFAAQSTTDVICLNGVPLNPTVSFQTGGAANTGNPWLNLLIDGINGQGPFGGNYNPNPGG